MLVPRIWIFSFRVARITHLGRRWPHRYSPRSSLSEPTKTNSRVILPGRRFSNCDVGGWTLFSLRDRNRTATILQSNLLFSPRHPPLNAELTQARELGVTSLTVSLLHVLLDLTGCPCSGPSALVRRSSLALGQMT
jgi:hypothetical protein